ncbi:hypothetical protein B4N89_00085 [Embleya scabrispora]|uniref:Uncharacterized protein n=1 Tax=Embleya scabrispora TaxID=159449 RepID=A0A1T3NRY8_9ACTN|nr:hypothetical protein B4N89_00085 [Embleya scabrispora]
MFEVIAPLLTEADLHCVLARGEEITKAFLGTSLGPRQLARLSRDAVLHVFRSGVDHGARADVLGHLVACLPALRAHGVDMEADDVCRVLDDVVRIWP